MARVESSLTLTSQGVLIAPLWTPNHTTVNGNYYKVDTLVNYEVDGVLFVYRCIADNDSIVPTNTSYWVNLGPGYLIQQEKPDWNATEGDSQILNKPDLVEEAPIDGVVYSRKDGTWVATSLSPDEIVEVETYTNLPSPGAINVLYITLDTGQLWIWDGSYSEVSQENISPLSTITEAGNVGIARTGRNPLNYGNIGANAVDLSLSTVPSSAYGATGVNSFATGKLNQASGSYSSSEGFENKSTGIFSSTSGLANTASGYAEMAIGFYGTSYVATETGTDRLFNIGAGPSSSVRKDVFTVYRNSAAKFFPTGLSGILNSSAGMLVFDSSDSNRPTIHNGIAWKKLAYQDDVPAITIDSVPTNGSTNAVSSNGVFDALALKADLVAGKVPSSQLPSYVDDVVEGYYSTGVFYSDAGLTTPITGEVGKIYIDLLLNQSYRWSGSVYVQISNAVSGINDLTDVTISSPLNGQLIQYNTTTSQWENKSIVVGTGDMQKSTYDIDNDGVVDYSETIAITVRNPSVSDILRKGTIVYLSGSTGYRPNAYKAQANSEATSSGTFGAVVSDIGLNSDGLVAAIGTLHDLDTRTAANGATYPFTNDTLADGNALWLDPNNAGYVTNVKPQAPNHIVFIGVVARTHPSLGRIVYRITNGYELDELHNVAITTPLDNQVLTYETSTSLWKNKVISQGTPFTRQQFSYVGSNSFTLSSTPSSVYLVFVNGQELDEDQYSVATNVLTIVDTLYSGYKINILYTPVVSGILDYYTKAQIDAFNYEPNHAEFVEVNDVSDLPASVGGVHNLVGGYTYLFLKHIDLLGARISCGVDTVIVGWSSENCSIKSTGLSAATALITSTHSLPIRNISFTHDKVFDLQGDGVTTALDWFGVNLLNCTSGGTIKNYTNFVASDSALLNSGGFVYDGTIGTVAFSNTLFDTAPGTTAITILPTCTISRRVRIIYSSFVVLSGETGINFDAAATVGDERYILDTVNFSGGGTYVSGLSYPSNKTIFSGCIGITNTSTRGFMSMINNTTYTSIPNTAVYYKAAGVTTASTLNSKFSTPSGNNLTYTGAFSQAFIIQVNCNVRTSVSTQNINIGIAKNGTFLTESEMTILCAAGSTPSFGATQCVVEMAINDYVELYVRNTSSVNNVMVSDMNFSITKIPV